MNETKAFTMRMDKDLWLFLKRKALDREMSLVALINERLEKYKKKCEKGIDTK